MTRYNFWLSVGLVIIFGASTLFCGESELRGADLRLADPPVGAFIKEHLPPKPTKPLPPNTQELQMFESLLREGRKAEAERVAWILGDWQGKANIPLLLEATKHPEITVQKQAILSLGRLSGVLSDKQKPAVMGRLTRILGSDNPLLVKTAVRSLGLIEASGMVSEIARYINSDDEGLVLASVRALGNYGDPDALQYIEPVLKSQSPQLTTAAIRSLAKLGKHSTARSLLPQLDSNNPSVKVAAIRAISTLGATSMTQEIINQLDNNRPYVRRTALEALLELDGNSARQAFISFTEDEAASVRLVATRAIGQLKLQQGIKALVRSFSDENKYVRQAAVSSLVAIGNQSAAQEASSALSSNHDHARACASQSLGRLKSKDNLQEHVELLEDDYIPCRQWAAWALGEIGATKAAADIFSVAFQPDQDTQVTAAGILSLGKLGYHRVLDKCHKLLPQKPTMNDPGVPTPIRVAAARAMGLLKDQDGIKMLESRLDDWEGMMPDTDTVRAESAIALGRIGANDALSTIKKHLVATEETRRVRLACKWAIREITGTSPDLELPPYPHPTPNYFVTSLEPTGQ